MHCWCGHGPWHYAGYPYPPYPPPGTYGPPEAASRRWGLRRRPADADELAEYLRGLEEEIARVRRDLDDLRESGSGEPR